MEEIVTLVLISKPENIRIARAVVSTFLKMREIQDHEIWDTELGLNEALANIIKHTYKSNPTKVIRMSLCWLAAKRELLITLRDYGEKVDPTIFQKVPKPQPDKEGGFGLYIMRKIFDVIDLENLDTGNLLRLRKVYT